MTSSVPAGTRIRIRRVEVARRPMPLRMPFRLGAIQIDELSTILLRVDADCDGAQVTGIGASVLSPMWFDKAPDRDLDAKTGALLTSIALAASGYGEAATGTAWDLHRAVQPAVHEACVARGVPALTSSFGVALLDSAIVDALCRHRTVSFHAALVADLFGFGAIPRLPARPRTRVPIRHTVGLADPLTPDDVERPLDDGLPETLDEVVRTYGVHYFKIKVGSDTDANLDRLAAIQHVLDANATPDYRVVLDGNEAFAGLDEFVRFIERFAADDGIRRLYDRVLWIEQPVARDVVFADGASACLRAARRCRPVILDESDATDDAVDRAMSTGYAGVSAKNCKGVFRTLHAARVLANQPGAILSAEDLTLPAIAPFHQDTAVVASLGLPHVERNGHHYVRGLSFLPAADQRDALETYPSLYESVDGLTRLRIDGGAIDVTELVAAPYGVVNSPDISTMTAVALPDISL